MSSGSSKFSNNGGSPGKICCATPAMRQPFDSWRTTQNGLVGLRLPVGIEIRPRACDSRPVAANVVNLADGELRGIAGRRRDIAVQGSGFLPGDRAEHPRGGFVVAGSHGFEELLQRPPPVPRRWQRHRCGRLWLPRIPGASLTVGRFRPAAWCSPPPAGQELSTESSVHLAHHRPPCHESDGQEKGLFAASGQSFPGLPRRGVSQEFGFGSR